MPLIRELIYIVLVIAIIGFMLEKKNTFISLMFTPYTSSDSEPLSLKNLLFSACLTDLILKLFTVGFKILFTMLPACAVEYKNRVNCRKIYFTLLELMILFFILGTNIFNDGINLPTLSSTFSHSVMACLSH